MTEGTMTHHSSSRNGVFMQIRSRTLVETAYDLIEAGQDGSTSAERHLVAAMLADRAHLLRKIYEGKSRYLPALRRGQPRIAQASERYRRFAIAVITLQAP